MHFADCDIQARGFRVFIGFRGFRGLGGPIAQTSLRLAVEIASLKVECCHAATDVHRGCY